MANITGEPKDISPVLFLNVKGEPMFFFIRPGPIKKQLQPLITSGGGILCRRQDPNSILLAEPGELSGVLEGARQFYISTQYIRDSVMQNRQLDVEGYRFSTLQPVQTRASSQKQRGNGRMGYSPEDDAAILNFIAKRKHEAKGNRVWQQMEKKGITSHSWQSMKDRFLKHLQHKQPDKNPDKKAGNLSSDDNLAQTPSEAGTPKKMRKKAPVIESSDSDVPQGTSDDQGLTEGSPPRQPNIQPSPEISSSAPCPDLEKNQASVISDKAQEEPSEGNLVQELLPETEQPQCNQDSEESGPSPKRARKEKNVTEKDTSDGQNNNPQTPRKTGRKGRKTSSPASTSATPRRKLGILERAAREFEDSQVLNGSQEDGSQEDRPPSRTSSVDASDTDETQILAAREKAVREQQANTHPNEAEQHVPEAQNDGCVQENTDDVPGPSRAALPITSNTHMFLFNTESQEDLSQASQENAPSQNSEAELVKQQILDLKEKSNKDLPEVIKALLKASGDVTLALSFLLVGYNPEAHGPIWTKNDDQVLLSDDSSGHKQLQQKYGTEQVSKRAAFLKVD